jgi:hypothetical protein
MKTQVELIEESKIVLESNGFCVDVLWSASDVHSVVECTDKEAGDIMYNALTNENVVDAIWFAIKDYAQTNGFKLKDESDV